MKSLHIAPCMQEARPGVGKVFCTCWRADKFQPARTIFSGRMELGKTCPDGQCADSLFFPDNATWTGKRPSHYHPNIAACSYFSKTELAEIADYESKVVYLFLDIFICDCYLYYLLGPGLDPERIVLGMMKLEWSKCMPIAHVKLPSP